MEIPESWRSIFFSDEREHYGRPLIGKYREQIVECLRAF